MKLSIERIKSIALEELDERLKLEPDTLISENVADIVHEIAGGSVPVYDNRLIEIAQNSIEVMTHENDLPPSNDGSSTTPNIIATSIYEIVQETLFHRLNELKLDYLDDE